MELFKHAIFTGEFEREECSIRGIDPTSDWNLPLLRIEAPPGNGFVSRLPLDAQPQEFFAVKSATIGRASGALASLTGGDAARLYPQPAESYGREGSAGRMSVAAKSLPLNSRGRSRVLASA